MVNVERPLWWSLPTMPSTHREALSRRQLQQGQGASSSRSVETLLPTSAEAETREDEHPEVSLLWDEVHLTLNTLRGARAWQWIAELKLSPWVWNSDEQRRALERLTGTPLPPHRYTVELMLIDPDAMSSDHLRSEPSPAAQPQHQLRLTPAELALITQLDYDVGRRIGDELDGISPQVARSSSDDHST